jgi:hypothetical protein
MPSKTGSFHFRTLPVSLLTHLRIGEITLMKDLTKTMDITMKEMDEQEPAPSDPHTPEPSSTNYPSSPPPYSRSSGTSTPRPHGIPTRLALDDKAHLVEEDSPMGVADMTEEERVLRDKQKKRGGLTKDQREELLAFEQERKKRREERVATLSRKLINYISVWTETDKGPDVTKALEEKTRFEIENLKMESFGIDILHAMGFVYVQKASSFLKSQKLFGIGGMWSRLKEKGSIAKETWATISTAIDAQMTMEEMVRMEEKGGEDWTDERKAEYEKKVTGMVLAAAWRGSKYEIQSILRDVCEKVLNDKSVRIEKRMERAQALIIIGDLFSKVSWACSFEDHGNTLTTFRLREILKKKVILWHSSSSWLMHNSRRKKRRDKRQKGSGKNMGRKSRRVLHRQDTMPKPAPERSTTPMYKGVSYTE